jgi:16S rRNA U516 pseudouridylate synthase RsuA-like enzyme
VNSSEGIRLQKILSQAGIASRRAAEKLIEEGRVSVNGHTIREMGVKADPAADDIKVDGRRLRQPERHRYILLNKPAGVVTTRSDPQRRRTVIDLVGVREYVYPVGRLDYERRRACCEADAPPTRGRTHLRGSRRRHAGR